MNPSLTGAGATLVAVVVADMDPVATLSTVTVLSSRQIQLTQGQVSEDPEEKERIIFTLSYRRYTGSGPTPGHTF